MARLSAQQPRHLVDCLDQGIDLLAQPRLGAAVLAHPLLDQRARQGPDIGFGVEPPADPLDQHHGLLQQQQLRLRLHLELLGHMKQLRQEAGDRDLVQRPAEDRLADRAAGLGESVDRAPPRHITGVEMHLGDPPVIAGQKAEQHVG